MSGDSLRGITLDWGQQVDAKRVTEAKTVFAPIELGECYDQEQVEVVDPITTQANLSTDGGMIMVRGEGWKEVKLCVISEVSHPQLPTSTPKETQDPPVKLRRHSYQAGLWDADSMGQHQYLEGSRRQIGLCRLSSANDGAPWIARITTTNYPKAVQILDWGHADERIWKVAKAAFGEGTQEAKQWAETNLEQLWLGQVKGVVDTLRGLDWEKISCTDDIRQSPDYFETRQSKMEYDRFRQEGYPIGSGTVESAVNTVVHHRLKRQGRGWKRENAQAMLAALSELHSNRFQLTWQRLAPG
jgi:hypothetical protein